LSPKGFALCQTSATIYGSGSAFNDGREKTVVAICRKVIAATHTGEIEVWSDGNQARPLVRP